MCGCLPEHCQVLVSCIAVCEAWETERITQGDEGRNPCFICFHMRGAAHCHKIPFTPKISMRYFRRYTSRLGNWRRRWARKLWLGWWPSWKNALFPDDTWWVYCPPSCTRARVCVFLFSLLVSSFFIFFLFCFYCEWNRFRPSLSTSGSHEVCHDTKKARVAAIIVTLTGTHWQFLFLWTGIISTWRWFKLIPIEEINK